ncbi:Bug family tripartite tricarboxylate transporter substrate binding protein [Cupriavidus necator]
MKLIIRTGIAVTAAIAVAASALAQSFPNRPITIVVPFAAGGAMDATARLTAEQLRGKLGQPVLVDNRTGTGGAVGTQSVQNAKADGYTLLFTNQGPNVIREILYPDTEYKTTTDFQAVSMLSVAPLILVVSKDSSIKSLADLVKLGKQASSQLNYGSSGVGSPANIAAESLNVSTGTRFAHIPYAGASKIVAALLGNEVQMAFLAPSDAMAHVRSGSLRAIGVTSDERYFYAPEVPTIKEGGIKDVDFNMSYGLMVPASTPQPVVQQLNTAVVQVLAQPEIRERLHRIGFEPQSSTPAQMMDRLRSDKASFQAVIRRAGIKAE